MKITKEQIEEMRELKEKDMTFKEIAEKFNVNATTVYYHLLDKESQTDRKKKIAETFNKKSKDYKFKAYKKKLPTMKKYQNKRYAEDEEYREMKKRYAREYYRRKHAKHNQTS